MPKFLSEFLMNKNIWYQALIKPEVSLRNLAAHTALAAFAPMRSQKAHTALAAFFVRQKKNSVFVFSFCIELINFDTFFVKK